MQNPTGYSKVVNHANHFGTVRLIWCWSLLKSIASLVVNQISDFCELKHNSTDINISVDVLESFTAYVEMKKNIGVWS